jgi:hypothetical protein
MNYIFKMYSQEFLEEKYTYIVKMQLYNNTW